MSLFAATVNNGMMSSYEGRHFYVGFLDNEVDFYWDPYMTIYISSKYDTDVTVTEPQANKTYTFKLKKDDIAPIKVARGYEHLVSEQIYQKMLIEISSKFPISCVAKSASPQSSDQFSIIPTRNWGTEHYAVTMPNDFYYEPPDTDPTIVQMEKTPRLGEFLILADENNTNVEITMADDSFRDVKKDSTIKIKLNKGESYLVKSKYTYGLKGVYDLTGSHIVSDKPVGFVSGHMRTAIQQQDEFNELETKDHIVEMLPPTNAWGKEYISLPFGNGIGSMFKVIAKDTINILIENDLNTNNVYMLPGEVKQFDNITTATHWVADGRFLLTQFMSKSFVSTITPNYDPSMVVVPALNKMVSKVTYFASNDVYAYSDGTFKPEYLFQAVLLLTTEAGKATLEVNGKNVNNILGFNEIDVDTVKYYWQKVFVPPDPGIVRITCESGAFSAIAMGNGSYDSYSMTVGASLLDENIEDNQSPIVQIKEDCSAIRGFALDSLLTDFSGINIIEIDEGTYNFKWDISPITDTSTYVDISGEMIDKNLPAYFKITVYDYFGNSTPYEFYRPGAQVTLQDKVDFKEINVNKDSCIVFSLKTDADSVLLESIDLPKDLRLKLVPPFGLPKMLYKNQDYRITLCLDNDKNNRQSILDSMFFNFACDYSRKVDINATLISYDLSAQGLMLPKILGGTTYYTSDTEFVEFTNIGNVTIIADSVILPTNNYFTVDTTGMFPDTLLEGESIRFNKISFTHTVAGTYQYTITLMDNKSINRQATITGKVGTPKINNIYCDFGDTRIGTLKDTTLSFFNSGTFLSKFVLVKTPIESNIKNDPNVATLLALDTVSIDEFNKKDINFTYNPTDVNDFVQYKLVAKFVERWSPHDTITVTLLGQPTLPKIQTYNIDMDTIKISKFRDSTVKVLSSLGNEKLSISRIFLLSGDENVFTFDNTFYASRAIGVNTDESIGLRFNGLTLGRQNMTLIVESDAMPNFETKVDTIHITGFVEKQDTLNLAILTEDKQIISCNYDTLNLQITNTGNTNLTIDNINILTTNISARLIDNKFGDTLTPLQGYTKKVLVFASGNLSEPIVYEIKVHDIKQNIDSTFYANSELESKQLAVTINPFNAQPIKIGEHFDIKFSGSFPNEIDTTADIELSMNIDFFNFYMDDPFTTIRFFDKFGQIIKEIKVKVVKVNDIFKFESDELKNFDFTNISSWEFNLKFLTLLSSKLKGEMELRFNLSDCYSNNSLANLLNINEICIFNIRNVNLSSYISDVELDKNVISDELGITVNATDKLSGSVYLINYLGKKYSLVDKILFDKGKNNIILNLSEYANGKYILVVDSNGSTFTKEFIITK